VDDTSSDKSKDDLVENKAGDLDALLGKSLLHGGDADASSHGLHDGNDALSDGSATSSALVGGTSGVSALSFRHLLLGLFGLLGSLLGLSSGLSALLGGLAALSALLGGASVLSGLLGSSALSSLAGVRLGSDGLLLDLLFLDGDNLLERHDCFCQFSVYVVVEIACAVET